MEELITKLDIIINMLDSFMNHNDWIIQLICSLIGAIALVLSVFIGAKSLKSKIQENKIDIINKADLDFDKQLWITLTSIEDIEYNQLNYKLLEQFYDNRIKPLIVAAAPTSKIRNTGTHIIERYAYNMFTFRLRNMSNNLNHYYNKIDMVDSKFFNQLQNMLNYVNFASKKFITSSKHPKTLDTFQKELGGPKQNYQYQKYDFLDNTITYDSRFFLYYDLFKIVNLSVSDSSTKAFAFIVQEQILLITSKFLFENKFYVPLSFSSDQELLPKFYLAGINIYTDIISNRKIIKARYINFFEYFVCTKNYAYKINHNTLSELDIIDEEFQKRKMYIKVDDNDSILLIDYDFKSCESFYKDFKRKILRKFRKIHNN